MHTATPAEHTEIERVTLVMDSAMKGRLQEMATRERRTLSAQCMVLIEAGLQLSDQLRAA